MSDLDFSGRAEPPDEGLDFSDRASPKPRRQGERFRSNVREAARRNPIPSEFRSAIIDPDSALELRPRIMGFPSVNVLAYAIGKGANAINPGVGERMRDRERARREAYAAESAADPFYRAPGGVAGRAAAGASTLAGQVVGSALDPTNLVGAGKSIAQRAATQGAVNALGDIGAQGADVRAGVQDEYSPEQTAFSAAAGVALSGGMDLSARAIRSSVTRARARPGAASPPDFSARAGDAPAAPPAPPPRAPRDVPAPDFTNRASADAEAPGPPKRAGGAIADRIRQEATRRGIDPETAVGIGLVESNLDPRADNPNSSAGGVFQFVDRTWNAMGGGDKLDADLNISRGVELIRRNTEGLRRTLGREPQPWEVYLSHQQGLGGARSILRDPNRRAVDVVGSAAVRLNGGRADMTAGEFAGLWRDRFNAKAGQGGSGSLDVSAQRAREGGPDLTIPPRRTAEPEQADRNRSRVLTPDGESDVLVRYTVAELDDLKTSNRSDLSPNPDYPAELQPRDRTRAASAEQVSDIARNLRPELLGRSNTSDTGAPLIGPDGVVESGNGRTLAISRAYAEGGPQAQAYREFIAAQGFDPAPYRNPVLVRMRESELTPEQRVDFTRRSNARSTAAMSAGEQSRIDADKLTLDVLDAYTGGSLTTEANAGFIRSALSKIASPAELPSLVDARGRVSQDGLRRVQGAYTQRAYGDTQLVGQMFEDSRPELGGLGRALQDAAPAWATVPEMVRAQRIAPEWDATRPLLEAAALVRQAREGKVKLAERFTTRDAFDTADPRTEQMVRLFYSEDNLARVRSQEAIRADLESYVRTAREAESGAMFGGSSLDAIRGLVEASRRKAEARPAPPIVRAAQEPAFAAREAEPVLGMRTERVRLADGAAEQGLFEGVAPLTEADRLRQLQNAPKRGGNAPPPAGGLFNEVGRSQGDLLDGPGGGRRLGARSGPVRPEPVAGVVADLNSRGVPVRAAGEGVGGPRLEGLEGRWSEAVEALSRLQSGDAIGVLRHPAIGPIDVIWGNENGGLAHILRDHPGVVADLPERLARMEPKTISTNRAILESADDRAVARFSYDGRQKTWLLTAYELEDQPGAGRTDSGARGGPADSPDRLAADNIAQGAPDFSSRASAPPRRRPVVDLSAYGNPAGASAPATRTRTGLREAPRPGAAPARPEREALETVSQLAAKLRTSLGLTARQGRMTLRGALGEYDPNSGVIRTKAVQELDVLSHEGGHALDYKRLPALDAAIRAHSADLKPLSYPGAPKGTERREGFAEFFRWYVTNPKHARKVAPRFYPAFEAAMRQAAPDMLRDLLAIQRAYQQFLAAPAVDVLAASVVRAKRPGGLPEYLDTLKASPLGRFGQLTADAYTAFVDDLHPLNRAVRQLQRIYAENKGQRLDLRVARDPYALARLSRDAYASGHMDLMHGVRPYQGTEPEGPGLADALSKALGAKFSKWDDEAVNDFGAYLISRRMVHEWARYDRGDMDRPPDGLTAETHKRAIADFEVANPTWGDAAAMVYEWNNALWKKERDGGLITPEQYDSGLSEHPDYVPAMRDMSERTVAAAGTGATGTGKSAGGVARFRGSTRAFINPVQSMMRRSYEVSALLARNDALKALDDLAQAAGRGSAAIVERIPTTQVRGVNVNVTEALERAARDAGLSVRDVTSLVNAAETALGPDASVSVFRRGEINESGEPIVYVWREGEKQALRLPDGRFGRDMFNAITGMNTEQKSLFLDMAAAPTQLLRYGVTASPEFFISNYIRDQLSVWINTNVGVKPFVSGARGIASEVGQTKEARLYASVGGITGGANVAALPRGRVDRDIQALRKKGYTIRRFQSWQGLAQLTEISETGTRLGVFKLAVKQAKKDGLNDYEAALEGAFTARDYMDFGRNGSRMLAARRVVTFLNAAIQGLDKTTRVLTADGNLRRVLLPLGKKGAPQTPAEVRALDHARKAWVKIAALGVFGLALRALYTDDPEYEEISDYLRATHWMVKLGGEWVAVPKPFELATLSNIFERGYERVAMQDPTAWKRLAKGLGETVVPPHEIPAIATPFQIARNRNHSGQPIVPDHLKGAVDPREQFNSYTSEFGKFLGRQLNVSPAVIDHVVTGFGGSLGRYALQASNVFGQRGAPIEAGLEDSPVIRRFVRDVSRGSNSSAEFWRLIAKDGGKLVQAEGTFRMKMRDGKDAEALAYLRQLKPVEQAYVRAAVLSPAGMSKVHPLIRAREAGSVISDLRREVKAGELVGPRGEPIALTPSQRAQVDDALSLLQMTEVRNGLIAAGVEGWAQKAYIPRRDALERLQAANPAVVGLLNVKMAAAKVPNANASMELWPRLDARLRSMDDATASAIMTQKRTRTREGKMDEVRRRAVTPAGQ